jgi:hypothetical protein
VANNKVCQKVLKVGSIAIGCAFFMFVLDVRLTCRTRMGKTSYYLSYQSDVQKTAHLKFKVILLQQTEKQTTKTHTQNAQV